MTEKGERIVGRYELVERLGEGGMGVVWRARDTRLGRSVAVKLLAATALGNDTARARLIREAHAAATLEHEGIVRVYDVGEVEGGGAFLVMELVRGHTLREALEKGELGPCRILGVITDAARALGAAHAAGIVHRDVKPDNIMLRDDGRVIVVDFGVAKPVATPLLATAETVAGVTSASLTGAGQLVGTPAYLAPEQARGLEVSPATDQFALAVTAYEALTGKLPWTGNGVVEIVASILRDAPPAVSSVVPLPSSLGDVLARALSKDPGDRWADICAFADELAEIASALPPDPGGQAAARPSGKARAALSTPKGGTDPVLVKPPLSDAASEIETVAGPGSEPRPAEPRSLKRSPLIYVIGIIALGGVGYATMHSRMNPPAVPPTRSPTTSDTVACPPFVVTGMEPWIGGAAAAMACERVQIARGGADARTISPAELANAPHDCIQPIKADLFADAAAHDRYVATSKEHGARYLDGLMERKVQGFAVEIVLRDPAGAELARGKGDGVELFEAIRDALRPSLAALPPMDAKDTKAMKDWLDVGSPEEASDLFDVRTAVLVEDPVSLKAACDVVAKRTSLPRRVAYLAKVACARKLRTGKVTDPVPPIEDAPPGALITTILAQETLGGSDAVRERATRLERAAEGAPTPDGKARMLAAAAEVYNLIADPRARDVARLSVQTSAKAVDWRTSSWHRLVFSSEGDAALGNALAAWQPWEPVTQSLPSQRSPNTDPREISESIARSYALAQRGYYANAYGEQLLNEGKIEAASGVAALTKDQLLEVAVLLAQAKYGEALRVIPSMLAELPAKEESAALAFRLAQLGVRAALVLGRSSDFVDGVVTRYVDAEPHAVVDGVVPFASLVGACTFAPKAVGKRCIDRLEKLRSDGRLPTIFNGVDRVLEGAGHFVAEDYAGATRAWRQLLRAPGWLQEPLRDSLAVAFDGAGEPDLAEEVDRSNLKAIEVRRSADLSWVRAARRAAKKGDDQRARKFAEAVVDKWRFADAEIPAVAEMKALLAKLPPSKGR